MKGTQAQKHSGILAFSSLWYHAYLSCHDYGAVSPKWSFVFPKPDTTLVKETLIKQQKTHQKGFPAPRATAMRYMKRKTDHDNVNTIPGRPLQAYQPPLRTSPTSPASCHPRPGLLKPSAAPTTGHVLKSPHINSWGQAKPASHHSPSQLPVCSITCLNHTGHLERATQHNSHLRKAP